MPRTPLQLLTIVWLMGACSCASKLPEAVALDLPAANVTPEFSGGPKTPEIAEKKEALIAEYQNLARAEAELDRERMSVMTLEVGSPFGGYFGHSTRHTQRAFLAQSNSKVSRSQANVERLTNELTQAGVMITTRH